VPGHVHKVRTDLWFSLEPQITEIVLADSPPSHEDLRTPEFLGVLRIGDLPRNIAFLCICIPFRDVSGHRTEGL